MINTMQSRVQVAAVLAVLSMGAVAQNASIPALSEEPGQSTVRAPDGSYGVEHIDPFTGALKVVTNDLVVPSNGGLDIVITRSYVSMQKTNSSTPGYLPGRTATGIGWDIHFGRVWRNSATQGYTLPAGTHCTGVAGGVSAADSRYNPVLELPDGSRQVLVTGDTNSDYKFITADQWIGRCSTTGDGGLVVVSPAGIIYTFNKLGRVADGSFSNSLAFLPTRIEHPNGTFITITYATITYPATEFMRVDTVTHSEGQSVTFEYDEPGTRNARLHRIRLNGSPTRTWTYDYDAALTVAGISYHYLSKVTRPDGESFDYTYYTSGTGQYSLHTISTPLKATITYDYAAQSFPRHTEGAISRFVVHSKQIGGSVDANGTWTYTYTPASTAGQTTDVTQVDGPTNCVFYEHQSATTTNGQLWRIGLLLNKRTRATCGGANLRNEVFAWGSQMLAGQAYWRAPGVTDADTLMPRLESVAITQDGTTYTTTYSDFDAFGNARQVDENGQDSRGTNRTFLTDTGRWIVQRLKNETINAAGTVYTSPTTSVTANYPIVRAFFANGDLQTQTRAGIATDYAWYTSGSSRGEINTITDANSKVVTYSSYKRGIAQDEARVLDASTTLRWLRTINNTGTISDETNPVGRVTGYSYDENEELTGITTPKPTDDNIAIARGDPALGSIPGSTEPKRRRTLMRGSYREVRVFDGLGKLREIKLTDTVTGQVITKKFELDSEGRVKKAYLPSFGTPTLYESFAYDALGRIGTVTHADSSQVMYEYLASNQVRVTNERGFATTYSYRSYGTPDQHQVIRIEARAGLTPTESTFVTTDITRNKIDQVTSVTQGGLTRSYRYNDKFLLTYEIDPELGTITYGRDAIGNLITKSVGSSGTTFYILDNLYRLGSISYSSGSPVATGFEYYNDGLLKRARVGQLETGRVWTYNYDENGNLLQETANSASETVGVITYTYNTRDALSTIQYPSGLAVSYTPNSFGQPTGVQSAAGNHVSSIVYFPNGQIDMFTTGDGYTTDWGQNNRLLPTTQTVSAIRSGANYDLIRLTHDYDTASNMTTVMDHRDSSKNRTMTYDGANRLRTGSGPYGLGGAPGTVSFTYDARNNLMTKTTPTSSWTYNYNVTSGRLDSISQTGGGTMAYAYDVYGNVTANGRGTQWGTFTFDDASNLTVVGSPTRISYSYDGNRHVMFDVRADGSSNRTSLYNRADKRLYDFDSVNFEAIDYIYLGSRLIATRSRCTSSVDTDGDGIPNCVEWRSGMNPQSAADAAMDADNDGLTNLQEYQAGTNLYSTDTDGDSLTDAWERRYGLNATVSDSNLDSDGDTLTNLQEFQLGTRPDLADTDHDGIPDNLDPKPRFNPAVLAPILEIILQ